METNECDWSETDHSCRVYRCGETLVDDAKNPFYPFLGPVCGRKDREI